MVKIEVKWVHNAAVKTAQRTQLDERYLATNPDARGIYLVLWYPADQVLKSKRERIGAPWRSDSEPLFQFLRDQAKNLPRVRPCVLRLPFIASQPKDQATAKVDASAT